MKLLIIEERIKYEAYFVYYIIKTVVVAFPVVKQEEILNQKRSVLETIFCLLQEESEDIEYLACAHNTADINFYTNLETLHESYPQLLDILKFAKKTRKAYLFNKLYFVL